MQGMNESNQRLVPLQLKRQKQTRDCVQIQSKLSGFGRALINIFHYPIAKVNENHYLTLPLA